MRKASEVNPEATSEMEQPLRQCSGILTLLWKFVLSIILQAVVFDLSVTLITMHADVTTACTPDMSTFAL